MSLQENKRSDNETRERRISRRTSADKQSQKRKKDSTGNRKMRKDQDKAKKTKVGSSVISDSGNKGGEEIRKVDSSESLRKTLMTFMKQQADENKEIRKEIKQLSIKVTEDRPPVRSVYQKSNSADCSSVSEDILSKRIITLITNGLRIYIRTEIYGKIKFIKDDAMAIKLIKKATEKNYIQIPNGWTLPNFMRNMKKYTYRAITSIRQNNMRQARKRFIGKN